MRTVNRERLKEVNVSIIENVMNHEPEKTETLLEVLWNSKERNMFEIEQLRMMKKETHAADMRLIKTKMWAFTPSGEFSYVKDDCLLEGKHSGYICLDFDNLGTDIETLKAAKECLMTDPYIAYCGFSCSYTGLFALVAIETPSLHKQYFAAMADHYKACFGFEIDKSCSNLSRVRIISYDKDGYFPETSQVWDTILVPRTYEKVELPKNFDTMNVNERAFMAVYGYCTQYGIDITTGRNAWMGLAAFIRDTFGNAGKSYFDTISQYHPKFDQKDADTVWQWAANQKSYGLGVLGNICRKAGIPDFKQLMAKTAW